MQIQVDNSEKTRCQIDERVVMIFWTTIKGEEEEKGEEEIGQLGDAQRAAADSVGRFHVHIHASIYIYSTQELAH